MFELQEGHRIMEKMVRTFCEKEIAPHVEAIDSGEMLPYDLMRKMMNAFGLGKVAKDMLTKMVEKQDKEKSEGEGGEKKKRKGGLLSEAAGGMDDPLIMAVVGKEMCRVSPSLTLAFAASVGLCGQAIMAKGTKDQRLKYGIPVVTLDKIGCWALTEPESGSDAFALRTIARPDGDEYVINGSKMFATNAPYADVFVVYARIDRGEESKKDKRQIYPFILERGMKGLSTGAPFKKFGMKGSPTGEIFMEDVRVTRDNLLGGEEKPMRAEAKEVLASERTGAPFMAWGIIERCLDDCVKYAIERKQFGKSIAEFQLIQEKIAKMYIELENVKNLSFKQAWMMKNRKGTLEEYCAAKYYCANAAVRVGLEAIQLMGGYGYMTEYHVEMLMRDAKLIGVGGGTDEIQLLTIAKEIFRKNNFEISLAG
jgi:alkylation response protein AidB-like acyl-CoA dehydrogenase